MKHLLLLSIALTMFSAHADLIKNPDKNNEKYISSIFEKLNLNKDLSISSSNIFIGDDCSVVVTLEAEDGKPKKVEVVVEHKTKSKAVIFADASGKKNQVNGRCFSAGSANSSCVSVLDNHYRINTNTLLSKKEAVLSIYRKGDTAHVFLSSGDLVQSNANCLIQL